VSARDVVVEEGDQVKFLRGLAQGPTETGQAGVQVGDLAVELFDLGFESGDLIGLLRV
jgi:hypothetical protein